MHTASSPCSSGTRTRSPENISQCTGRVG
jgi:hypothetical protein